MSEETVPARTPSPGAGIS